MGKEKISWSINRRDDVLAKGMCQVSNIKTYVKRAKLHFPTDEERQAKFEALEKERRQKLKEQITALKKAKSEKQKEIPAQQELPEMQYIFGKLK